MSAAGLPRTTLYTIGHSTRTLDDLLALLEREGIRSLTDVRTFPGSRRYPHFNRETLAAALEARSIGYAHAPALGGRRRPRADSRNVAWRNEGFRGYADYMESDEFTGALDALLAAASRSLTTVMCAEAVPWRCHRSLIADAALARGARVVHVLDARSAEHVLTSFARVEGDRVRYDTPEPSQRTLFADVERAYRG